MSQQLVVGKYKFYPFEQPKEATLSPDELAQLCKKHRKKGPRAITASRSRKLKLKE